jgi:hypothetical protein
MLVIGANLNDCGAGRNVNEGRGPAIRNWREMVTLSVVTGKPHLLPKGVASSNFSSVAVK